MSEHSGFTSEFQALTIENSSPEENLTQKISAPQIENKPSLSTLGAGASAPPKYSSKNIVSLTDDQKEKIFRSIAEKKKKKKSESKVRIDQGPGIQNAGILMEKIIQKKFSEKQREYEKKVSDFEERICQEKDKNTRNSLIQEFCNFVNAEKEKLKARKSIGAKNLKTQENVTNAPKEGDDFDTDATEGENDTPEEDVDLDDLLSDKKESVKKESAVENNQESKNVKILWVHLNQNGPQSGMCELEGEKMWFLRLESLIKTTINYELFRLTQEQITNIEAEHEKYCSLTGMPLKHGDPIAFTKKAEQGKQSSKFIFRMSPTDDFIDYYKTINKSEFSNYSVKNTFVMK